MEKTAVKYVLQNLQTGEEIPLAGVVRIGRVRENTIVLDDEKVSRSHATIWEDANRLFIRDEGSTNGTLVNGTPVTQPTLLEPEAQIQIGNVTFELKLRPLTESPVIVPDSTGGLTKSFPWVPVGITIGFVVVALMALLIRSSRAQVGLLPTVTPSPEVVAIATAVVTPTNTLTLPLPSTTPTTSPTAAVPPVAATPTPGSTYAAPTLSGPANGSSHQGSPGPVLSWSSQGDLSGDEYYHIVVDYPHEGKTWREVGWSQKTSWQLPDYLLLLISGPNDCRWSVQVMRVTEKDVTGTPTNGVPLSSSSETWQFVWTAAAAPAPIQSPLVPTPTAEFRP